MPYLALQISIFIIIAIIAGATLGWWLKHMISRNEHEENRIALSSTRRNLKDARDQIYELRTEYQQAQQQIDKYTQHYNSDVYGEYLDTRKQLQSTRLAFNHLSNELSRKEQNIKRLQAELAQAQKLANLQHARTEEVIQRKMQELEQGNHQTTKTDADNLTRIPEINDSLAKMLNAFGIVNFTNLAKLTVEDANKLARMMGSDSFPNYLEIIEKAKQLCSNHSINDTKVAA